MAIQRDFHIQRITVSDQEIVRCDVWAVTGTPVGLVIQFVGGRDNLVLTGQDADRFLDWWMNPEAVSVDAVR